MDIVALAADHRGFALKGQLIAHLRDHGFVPLDLGTNSAERVDSQDFAIAAAKAIKEEKAGKAIIICGSGNGIAMAANRFAHMRAAICPHVTAARMSRQHNDANTLVLAADFMGYDLIKDCVDVFLKTEFLGGRYADRVARLTALDPKSL